MGFDFIIKSIFFILDLMGAQGSKLNEFGQIYIQVEKTNYYFNENITGTVHLNLVKDVYPGTVIYLKVIYSHI